MPTTAVDLKAVYAEIERIQTGHAAGTWWKREPRRLSAEARRNLSEGVRRWRARQHANQPMTALRRCRIERGLTQRDLARRANCHARTVMLAERDPTRLRPRTRRALARIVQQGKRPGRGRGAISSA